MSSDQFSRYALKSLMNLPVPRVADIEKLIADAKAGDDVIAADLKALGITV